MDDNLHSLPRRLIELRIEADSIDEVVKVRMLHPQFDQLPRQGVQVVDHARHRTRV